MTYSAWVLIILFLPTWNSPATVISMQSEELCRTGLAHMKQLYKGALWEAVCLQTSKETTK